MENDNSASNWLDDERVDCGDCKHRTSAGWKIGQCSRRGWAIEIGVLNHCKLFAPKIIIKPTVTVNDDDWYMD